MTKNNHINTVRTDIHRIPTQLTGKLWMAGWIESRHLSPLFSDNTPLNLSKKPTSSSSSSMKSNTYASLLFPTPRPAHLSSTSNNRRQRERTTFDPQEETPRLLQIFTDTKHPTRYQIASICETLNALPCRKGLFLSLSLRDLSPSISLIC